MNALASMGAVLIALSVLTMLINFAVHRRRGALAGPNPWNADTLEWSVASPPPAYNFVHFPTVAGLNAVWDAAPDQPYVTGMRFDKREILVTKALDAEPDHKHEIPGRSLAPFLLAITATIGLAGSIFFGWWFTIGMVLSGVVLIYWYWPNSEEVREHLARDRGIVVAEEAP